MSDLANKQIMAENIQYFMEKHQISRNEICQALGIKYTTFTDWIKANSYPRIDKIELMANYFGISKADLVEKRELTSFRYNATSIPVFDHITAGTPIESTENIIATEKITEDMANTGDFFGLQIHGRSMEPRMQDGDVVIVRKQEEANSGDIVIAMINDDAACKRLRKYRDGIELISNNPSFDPMFFANDEISEKSVKIIGKVVELRAKF